MLLHVLASPREDKIHCKKKKKLLAFYIHASQYLITCTIVMFSTNLLSTVSLGGVGIIKYTSISGKPRNTVTRVSWFVIAIGIRIRSTIFTSHTHTITRFKFQNCFCPVCNDGVKDPTLSVTNKGGDQNLSHVPKRNF